MMRKKVRRMIKLDNDWDDALLEIFSSPSYGALREFLKSEYAHHTVYPDMYDIFNAFKLTPLSNVKAVVLGQDPYHGAGQAMGLSFSVPDGIPLPPSLQNIYKERASDLGLPIPVSGDLTAWAKEGVLLLNTVLTVRAGQAGSHAGKGWEELTDAVIKKVNEKEKPVVFLLWGNPARAKKRLINTEKHGVIESAHPSPLSAYNGFFGSKPFSKANAFLVAHGVSPIDWRLNSEK